jgi:transposase
MPPPLDAAKAIEERRYRGLALLDSGMTLTEVAAVLGCATSTVMRWRDIRTRAGVEGLKVQFSTGRPRRMTANQRDRIARLLLKGAVANGFEDEGWTTVRIAHLVEQECGIEYHRCHMGRLMESLGWVHSDGKGWRQTGTPT